MIIAGGLNAQHMRLAGMSAESLTMRLQFLQQPERNV